MGHKKVMFKATILGMGKWDEKKQTKVLEILLMIYDFNLSKWATYSLISIYGAKWGTN